MKHCVTEECPQRGRIYFESQKFCSYCGKLLETMPICSGCAKPLENAEVVFCTYCGAEVRKKG